MDRAHSPWTMEYTQIAFSTLGHVSEELWWYLRAIGWRLRSVCFEMEAAGRQDGLFGPFTGKKGPTSSRKGITKMNGDGGGLL